MPAASTAGSSLVQSPLGMTTTPQKITFGEMRASGVRDVLIYCRDHRCSHHVETNADGWADDVRLFDIEPGFVCTRCGRSFRRRGWGLVTNLPIFR